VSNLLDFVDEHGRVIAAVLCLWAFSETLKRREAEAKR
jgi:hypothetical protein